jgi:hypothetical protein
VFQRLFAPPIAPRSSRRPKGPRLVEQSLGRPVEAEHQFEAAIGVGGGPVRRLAGDKLAECDLRAADSHHLPAPPGSRFRVNDLASQDPKVGVVFTKGRRTNDWNKITSHRTGAPECLFRGRDVPGRYSVLEFRARAIAGVRNRELRGEGHLRPGRSEGNSFEVTVAHECGHSFGALDNTIDGSLMRTPGPGKTISDQDATGMNGSLASAPPCGPLGEFASRAARDEGQCVLRVWARRMICVAAPQGRE